MHEKLALFIAMLLIPLFAIAAEVPKELDAYLALPDDSFRWEIVEKIDTPNERTFLVDLTSQTWQGIPWKHSLLVALPNRVTDSENALLVIGGSSTGRRPSDGDKTQIRLLAEASGMPAALLLQVPNQPLFGNYYEDALIGETLLRALETKDATFPLLFPMTKSAVRAMDAVQQVLKQEKQFEIKGFVVSGASKRGWTTWLTAASGDQRVIAIVPMVIDNLNIREQMQYQIETWGAFSPSIRDYTERNLIRLDETQASDFESRLWDMIDPYAYRERLALPKLLIHGTNDPYWAIDASKLYFDDLPGVKYILTLPNAGHGLDGQQLKAAQTAAAFAKHVAQGSELPTLKWKLTEHDTGYEINIETDIDARIARLWTARSETKDFRQARWSSSTLPPGGRRTVFVAKPESGHIAFFVELESISDGLPFSLTTQVWRF
ncbi:MAG: PhoPQ-activated pathogenicity-related family protein [Planctomycetaceae bacterium]|nr:PhoPQ-activated pathogenicity-related family protein [Planctomycetaceae bacterium]